MLGYLTDCRKRRDRWWRYHVLKDAYIQDSATFSPEQETLARLSKAVRRLGYPMTESLQDFWRELLDVSAAHCSELAAGASERVEACADSLDISLLPVSGWLDLFRFCIGLGLFQPAATLRDKALLRMIQDASSPGASLSELTMACYASLELGEPHRAAEWLGKMESSGCSAQRCSQARWFSALMSGANEGGVDGLAWGSSLADPAFGNLIRGRRIAVVGPVALEMESGPDIDGYDVVVKFGYRGGERGRDPRFQGKRVDVSYYNNTQAETLAGADFSPVFSELRWGVCHNRKGCSFFRPAPDNLRQLTSLQWFLPDTHLNAGPNALLDLLRFRPSAIHVFNTDLMLSSGRFAGYREKGNEETDYTRSFIKTHDPVLQYRIMHRLWSNGFIKGDARFEYVMALGLEGYLAELQKAYGAVNRALF